MPGITSHLYPPVITTYQPAFVRTNNMFKVYFSISQYNSYEEIQNYVQVRVSNQNTNASVLSRSKHPTGIKIIDTVQIDAKKITDDKYFITLEADDFENGFELNQYYKIQIRFSGITDPASNRPPTNGQIDQWLAENMSSFSEWSTITLIKAISEPKLQLRTLDSDQEAESITLATQLPAFVGSLVFSEADDDETLRKYRFRLYDVNDILLIDSGDIYSNIYSGTNEIYYVLNYMLVDGDSYRLVVDYTTRNYYEASKEYNFVVILNSFYPLEANINAEEDPELGRILVSVTSTVSNPFIGNITIRRSSSRTEFQIWEDVHTEFVSMEKGLDLVWADHSVESGIFYQYCAQRRDVDGTRGIVTNYSGFVMVRLNDLFLTAGGRQLKVKYNPTISSYRRTIQESKTDTIGSKYPFIKRNGHVNYRQFPLSGLISVWMDEEELFTNEEELLGSESIMQFYDSYNRIHRITRYNDYTLEREFREKVMDFLYADDVKLMRTATEGNILVKLMDISFTPEQTLGRMIYSFSCTAYEIDDCTSANLTKYGIQTEGTYSTEMYYNYDKSVIGQYSDIIPAKEDFVQKTLQKKYLDIIDRESASVTYDIDMGYLHYLRIEFQDPPYLVVEKSGNLVPLTTEEPDDNTRLGWIVTINGVAIFVAPDGVFELKGDEIEIQSLVFPVATSANIDYEVSMHVTESAGTSQVTTLYYNTIVGQISGSFSYEDSVIDMLWRKYYRNYSTEYRHLSSLNMVRIEADEGTVIWIKTSKDSNVNRFIMNASESLTIKDDGFVIDGLFFSGRHLEPVTNDELRPDNRANFTAPLPINHQDDPVSWQSEEDERFGGESQADTVKRYYTRQIPDNRFIDTGITVENIDELLFMNEPVYNGVYSVSNFDSFKKYREKLMAAAENLEKKVYADTLFYNILNTILTKTGKFIYYKGTWMIFDSANNDVLCPVVGYVDYQCDLERGIKEE